MTGYVHSSGRGGIRALLHTFLVISVFMSSFDREAFILKCGELRKSAKFIDVTLKFADHLTSQNLPVIFDVRHLSLLLGSDAVTLATRAEDAYKPFWIRKKGGGKRLILAPECELRRVQRWINETILKVIPLHECVHGFRNGRSIVSNARPHSSHEVVLNVDLKSFFHSVYQLRVYGIFRSLGYCVRVSRILARLTTVRLPPKMATEMKAVPFFKSGMAVLPQGAPTSPAIANIAARGLDSRFSGYALKHGLVYSRYADDITFSGAKEKMPSLSFLVQVVKEEGFWINFAKYRRLGRQHRQVVTGLVVNDGVRVARTIKREIWTHLYFAKKYGPLNHLAQRRIKKGAFRDWLLGNILFIKSVEPEVAQRMRAQFDAIDWSF